MSRKDDVNPLGLQSTNGGTDDFVAEEGPVMRSVALLNSPSENLFAQTYPEASKHSNLTFGAAGKGKLGIPKPSKGSLRESSFSVKKEWSAAFKASSWDICGSGLEKVPIDFPLERTHREINEDASVVASRITEALRRHSIQTEFDSKNAKAKCVTQDCVNFRIRLYAGGEYGQPVVVEVQRRSGSVSSFMCSCREILCAAEGIIPKEKKVPPYVKKPVGQMKCVAKMEVKEEQYEKEAIAALEGVIDMIRANRNDFTLLGLESLCCLTDPLKTSPVAAMKICKDIMTGRDSYDIREEIRVLTERDGFVPDFDQDGTPNHSEHFRHLALRVFSNCLNLCNKDGFLPSLVKEQRWFRDNLIPTLVDELKRAETSANNAYEASSCVFSLISCSDVALKSFVSNGGSSALQEAHDFGADNHELLQEESRRCLDVLQNASK